MISAPSAGDRRTRSPTSRYCVESWRRDGIDWADEWNLTPDGSSALKFTIRAESFCHNMVRCLTSALVEIGQGKRAESTIAERFVSLSRDHLPSPAPASGLALVAVGYETDVAPR